MHSDTTGYVNLQIYRNDFAGQNLLERTSSSEERIEEAIDGSSLFGYQDVEFTPRAEPLPNFDFLTNRKSDWMRLKRETTREGKDCELNVEHCEKIILSIKNYLMTLSSKSTDMDDSVFKELRMCLDCRKSQQLTPTVEAGNGSARPPEDRYQVHNYVVVPNRTSDPFEPSIADIELLDDGKAKDSRYHGAYFAGSDGINRTEATTAQTSSIKTSDVSQDAASGSSTNTIDTTVVSIDYTSSNGITRTNGADLNDDPTTSVSDVPASSEPTTSDSRIIKVPNGERTSTMSANNDDGRAIAQSNVAKSSITMLLFPTTETSTETRRNNTNSISMDSTTSNITATTIYPASSSETNTRSTSSVDFTRQFAISTNATSEPARRIDVIGIIDGDGNGTEYPAARPSHEGHSKNQSTATANVTEARSIPVRWPLAHNIKLNYLQTNSDGKFMKDFGPTGEETYVTKIDPIKWKMQPLCFYGPPGQITGPSKITAPGFYPGLLPGPSNPEPGPSSRSSSSQSNYVQVQVQLMPRLNYASNPAQVQPTVSLTGPGVPNLSLTGQQPSVSFTKPGVPTFSPTGQQSADTSHRVPYYCTSVPIPIISQPERSSTVKQDSPIHSVKSNWTADSLHKPAYSNTCPPNSRPCDSDGNCVPNVKWCDGFVDCTADASDEIACSCRDRIPRNRLCDGYFDCPHGEDELDCFGCPENFFSCGDWEHRRNLKNCVPLEQRCDGIKQCRNGKDELDCVILSPSYINGNDVFTIGYTQGYLHKNIRGQWYPVCRSEPSWVIDACESEAEQPLTAMPEIRIVRLAKDKPFQDPYVNGSDGKIQFVSSCSNTAVFVKCPPLLCGTRMHSRQNFSPAFVRDSGYVYKRQAEEKEEEEDEGLFDSEPRKFAKLYRETLGLLDENRLKHEERDGNDTLVGLQSRVVGGRASRPMAWPYLVAIYKDGDFHCGGVILKEVCVLTAAHCMDGYKTHHFEVRAGMLRRLSFSPTTQLRRVKNVMIHSDYRRLDMQNDVALVMLDEPLLFNRWVRQVCLPAADIAGAQWQQSPTSQSTCIAIGWGATREHGPDPDHLREVEVPILPSCKYSFDQNSATICAGYLQGGHDACQGDSGGPLMCRNSDADSQWYVAGVISHGDGCGRPYEPGVYTKVSHFVRWIREMLEKTVVPLDEDAPLDSCQGFSCRTGLGRCLPIDKKCDRFVDCLDAEDETDCFSEMSYGQYRQLDGSNEFVRSMPDEKSVDRTSNDTVGNQRDETVVFVPNKPQESTNKDEKSNAASGDTMAFEMTSVRLTFTCQRLIQTIMIHKRCDRRVDCQDGTDEDDCTCRDFLANLQPAAICDGHPDCDDRTDEKNCGLCKEDEFLCGRSGTCIPIARRCNGRFDCPLREDEIDCLALTYEDHVSVDGDNRPLLNAEGLLSKYENGTWRTECFRTGLHYNDTVMIGENTCQYLGFASLRSVDTIVVNKTELATRSKDWRDAASDDAEFASHHGAAITQDGSCTALRIRCGPGLSGSADSHLVVDPRTGSHIYLWPWLAAIFVNGRYRCSALLLEPNWLLSNAGCTRDIRLSMDYTTALLGRSRSYLYVDGPYQQISIVDEIKNLKLSNVSLLHLRTAVNFTHHALPLFVEKKIYPPSKNDLCVAIGTDEAHVTQSIFVQPILDNCDKCRRCFIETADSSCSTDKSSSSWSGTVFCRSRKGWYPAAVFHENDGPCSFRNIRNLTSIDYVQAYVTQALEEKVQPTAEPTCNGVRCNIGQCVPWNRVCDGVLDCRDGADERVDSCNRTQDVYDNNVNRKCTKSELRCGNDECIPRSAFCDDKVDCSDGTDEPVRCTCAEYLKLTAPDRLCDGVRHCVDKSDESPEMCQCTKGSFQCNTENGNVTCLPQDFVCDGDEDCPNKEDEKQCRMMKEFAADRPGEGEVMQRSYGVWHSRCFSAPVTSQEEARAACEKLGYANGTINQGIHPEAGEPTVPSRDHFYLVRLNIHTWINMRDDRPLVTLARPEEPCYRLFVKCTF